MIFDNSLAGLVSRPAVLSDLRPAAARTVLTARPDPAQLQKANDDDRHWLEQIILYCAIIVALTKPLGGYMTRVFNGERTLLSPVLRPVEAGIYWIGGVDEKREQHWLT